MPDILDSLQTSNSLSTDGSPVTSTVDSSGDQDWWRVLLSANTSYLFSMGAANASSLDTYLRLLDNSGSQITYDDDSGDGYNSLISYTPTSSGTYYISAQGYSSSTGDYTLSVNNNGSEIPASTDTTNALTINGEAAISTIGTSGDQDWWRVIL
ncbi:MAG: PPC domain-containing protein, partial [Magnetococcales bacterium]|nr:PPC domain-containing protein [Magnetococcales bacterium]